MAHVDVHGKVVKLHIPKGIRVAQGAGSVWPGSFPDRMKVHLFYGENQVRAPGTSFEFYNWRANGLFDPNQTGVGQQPAGFDQWMAFYRKFIVTKVRAHWMFQVDGNQRENLYTWPSMSVGGGLVTPSVISQPLLQMEAYCGTGCPPSHIRRPWLDIAEFLGMTPTEFRANEDCFGTATADPVTTVYMNTLVQASDNVSLIFFQYIVRFEYEVEFFDRVQLNIS